LLTVPGLTLDASVRVLAIAVSLSIQKACFLAIER